MVGHYTPNQKWLNEVWGLAVFSDNERYATCSDDGTVRIWSSVTNQVIKQEKTDLGERLFKF